MVPLASEQCACRLRFQRTCPVCRLDVVEEATSSYEPEDEPMVQQRSADNGAELPCAGRSTTPALPWPCEPPYAV